MFFQKVLKGIPGLSPAEAQEIIDGDGIVCNWWRKAGLISNSEKHLYLTEANLLHHLNDYDQPLPFNYPLSSLGKTYGEVTPYISTTAGGIERDPAAQMNFALEAFETALWFATNKYTNSGVIFYAYVFTLGKKAVELETFSEEVRELNIYRQFLPYWDEGEIVAKLHIPANQIEKFEYYDGSAAWREIQAGRRPQFIVDAINPLFADPAKYSNIREVI